MVAGIPSRVTTRLIGKLPSFELSFSDLFPHRGVIFGAGSPTPLLIAIEWLHDLSRTL